MPSTRPFGAALAAAGLAAYLLGIGTPYPGRAFSITLVMVGVTLGAIDAGGSAT